MTFTDTLADIIGNIWGMILFTLYVLIITSILAENLRDCDNVNFKDIQSEIVNICTTVNKNETCADADVFTLEEDVITRLIKNEMKIKDLNGNTIGKYFQVSDGKDNRFRYAYLDKDENRDYVVGRIKKKSFISQIRYEFKRCNGSGSNYEIREGIGFNKGDYELYKDKKLIAVSSSDVDFFCNPDITFTLIDKNIPLAMISRDCNTSFLRDKWLIINYNKDLVDNYVFGFLGYITTFMEEDD